ncbi:MAG TPA: cytochrome c oxidase subunit 3 [Alphaproteobacteria bacterium]|nr:cytochrome c oxidase subunit 3 [Alphaproteobacteria bacterium]
MAETKGSGIKQPYHLVEPSPWPIIGAIAAAVLALGALTYMHPEMFGPGLEPGIKALGPWKIIVGVVLVLFTMAGWWRDVIKEANTPGLHSAVVQLGLRYGMFLFITSEVMFFLAFFWAYFHFALFPNEALGGVWPPKGVVTFDPWDLPFLNTLILLTSGATVTWAHHALKEQNRPHLVYGLALTVLLGISFTAIQAYEYSHAAFGFREGVYPSTFFMATGFHGFHVIVGTIFLAVCLGRAIKGHFTPERHFGFEAAAWYWHFVDVVWLFLFICIYWWGAGSSLGGH